ncbi:helix-turn-helix domain-containing protein [Streptomyces sp. 6N223]|uniref:helix-turn-helix domain-containing protein n=1 Tax=Streptomyces sp. 6N223 TaxID=3457412 RepID=UPI003FD460FA
MELRRLRDKANVPQAVAAETIDGSETKISRVEAGKTGVNRLELVALLDLYGVKDEKFRNDLIELSRNSRKRGWWQQRRDIPTPKLMELIELESTASQIFEYKAMLVPGLFQTEDYARAVMSGFPSTDDESVESWVQVRMERQKLLTRDDAPRIFCILDEAALHRQIGGPKVMAAQLRKLVEINNPPHLSIQVLPFTLGAHAGTDGSFQIFSYPAPVAMDIVFMEQKASRVFVEEEADQEPYLTAAEHLRTQALSSPDSMRLISALAAEFDRT